MEEKVFITWQIVNLKIKINPVRCALMLQIAMNIIQYVIKLQITFYAMMQYLDCLRNIRPN